MDLKAQIKSFAHEELGIDLIGFTRAEADPEGEQRLADFVNEGRHAGLPYLEDYKKRVHPEQLLSNAKTVIVIAINYYREKPETPETHGRIARYAYGRDYHKVLRGVLKKLIAHIQKIAPESENRLCVDTAPLLEKSYAVKAGLGFTGKNTTLITYEFGSFVLLGEILTSLPLAPDEPKTGTCGTCTRCIDACPTQALVSPGKMDARRCISYLTIEHKGPIPEEFHAPMKNLIFGCDICQEVCPYNKRAGPLKLEALKAVKIASHEISLAEIMSIKSDEDYLKRFAGSPLMRAKRTGLQRNAQIAILNQKL